MKSGYKLVWSERALEDLKAILTYLAEKWTEKEIRNFATRLDKRLHLIATNPRLFPMTTKRKSVRKSVLTRHTVIYYKSEGHLVTIITLFDPRQKPSRLKL
jgi:plasmid stabilization system protein ParE